MIPQTGTVFLNDLHRRALANERLHLVETTAIAALAGGLSRVKIDEWGVISFGTVQGGLTAALAAAAVWLVLALVLQRLAREGYRTYIGSLLTDTGLLYLALEHDPHETLKPLTRRETLARLHLNPAAGLSFRGRMLALLRTYAACAGALGFHAYPALWRWLSRSVDYALIVAAGLLAWLTYGNMLGALARELAISPLVKVAAFSVLLLILVRATGGVARRSGLHLALTDVLQGDVERGQAILTRG